MKKLFLLLALTTVLLFACKHQIIYPDTTGTDTGGNNGGNNNNDSSGNGTVDTTVCFEGDVLPIFQTYCAKSGCHDAGTRAEGYVLNSYANIMRKGIVPGKPNNSELYNVIISGEMPPRGEPGLTKEQIAIIGQWIAEGAKNTTNCNTCDTSVYTYSGAVQPIMANNCIGCHSSTLASGGVDLSTYTGVKTVALNGKLIGTITHAAGFVPMPQGGNQLSDCNITQIQKWIDAGTLNN